MAEQAKTGSADEILGETPQFVHLRLHSAYSLLEGALPLKKVLGKAVADNQPAIAITDTNNLFVALEFAQKATGDGL
ncbi:PHP domain-containing protein, partial [Rhizobium sp.]